MRVYFNKLVLLKIHFLPSWMVKTAFKIHLIKSFHLKRHLTVSCGAFLVLAIFWTSAITTATSRWPASPGWPCHLLAAHSGCADTSRSSSPETGPSDAWHPRPAERHGPGRPRVVQGWWWSSLHSHSGSETGHPDGLASGDTKAHGDGPLGGEATRCSGAPQGPQQSCKAPSFFP